jgi:hypothetical protein
MPSKIYEVSIKARVSDTLIVEAESEAEALDRAAVLFHNEHASLDVEITDIATVER